MTMEHFFIYVLGIAGLAAAIVQSIRTRRSILFPPEKLEILERLTGEGRAEEAAGACAGGRGVCAVARAGLLKLPAGHEAAMGAIMLSAEGEEISMKRRASAFFWTAFATAGLAAVHFLRTTQEMLDVLTELAGPATTREITWGLSYALQPVIPAIVLGSAFYFFYRHRSLRSEQAAHEMRVEAHGLICRVLQKKG